jgi:hypothetical protein
MTQRSHGVLVPAPRVIAAIGAMPHSGGVMKVSWDQPLPDRGRSSADPIETVGYVRLDRAVVVPDLAVVGRRDFALEVLESPDTGDWFGEDPGQPGSALIPLDKSRIAPATRDAEAALEQASRISRAVADELTVRTAREFDDDFLVRATTAASDLERPEPEALVIDLGRAATGRVPTPARWWRTTDGVRLMTERAIDDPLGWVEEWPSIEALLVADSEAARAAAADLVDDVKRGISRRPSSVDHKARQAALRYLASVAPDLAALVSE